jgi:hypothetical protein
VLEELVETELEKLVETVSEKLVPGTGSVMGSSLFSTASRPALGPTQPLIQQVRGALLSGVKRTESEADHSPPSGADFKNA